MYGHMISALIVYGLVLITIASLSLRSSSSAKSKTAHFILADRSINFWVTALSAHASDMSQWLLMGFPAVIYMYGGFEVWSAIGLVFGMWFSWHFIAPALRRETEKFGALTLFSYFEKRLDDCSGLISLLSALLLSFFFTIYLSSGAKAIGFLLQSCFGINSSIGATLGIAIVVLYTFFGGYAAVAWVDCFQALFLLSMALLTPLFAFAKVGGLSAIISAAAMHGVSLSLLPSFSAQSISAILFGPLAWGLGYCGMPHILTKFMGAASADEMYKSKYIGIAWQIIVLAAAASVGFIGLAYFAPGELTGRTELIFIIMSQELFTPFVVGLVICGILAAIISTMDSQILVVASVIAENVYHNVVDRNATDRQTLFVLRASSLAIALLALLIAFYGEGTIYELVKYAWFGLGASFGPLVLLCLYSQKINRYGALAGMLAGGIIAAVWRSIDAWYCGFGISAMVPGFSVGLATIYGVSLLTRKWK